MPRSPRAIFSPILHPPPAILCPHLLFFFICFFLHFPCHPLCSLSFTVPTPHSASISHSVSSVRNPGARFAMLFPPSPGSLTLCSTRRPYPHPHPHAPSTMFSSLFSILLPPHSGVYSRRHAANPNPHASCRGQLFSRPSYMSLICTPHYIKHTFFPVTLVQSAVFFPSFPIPLTHNLPS